MPVLTVSQVDRGPIESVADIPDGLFRRLAEMASEGVVGETTAEIALYLITRAIDDMTRATRK